MPPNLGLMPYSGECALTFSTRRTAVTVKATAGERILFAGLRNGLDLPYECVSGTCGTCQAALLDPADQAVENLFPEAPAATGASSGRILMCQSALRDNIELRVFSRIQKLPLDAITPNYFRATLKSMGAVARSTVLFSLHLDRPLRYREGQFMAIAADSVKGYRAYSMHSPAVGQGSNDLDFVVRLSPQGAFSRWISTALMGTPLRLFGPLGRAVLAPDDPPRIFAIAGGTGIAGILPIFERLVSSAESEYHGALVFGLRTLSDAFFLDRLNNLVAQSADRIEVIIALSHEHAPATIHDFPRLKIESGFAVDVAQQYLATGGDLSETCFFVAGPSMLVESGLSMLRHQFHVQEQRIRFDRF